jgi:ATP-binding cassette subfamily B protein/ATP-binding cassette subfamily C protein
MQEGKKSIRLFAGVGFLIKLYWRYKKTALFALAFFCLIAGALPFAAIVFPKFILDELIGPQNIGSILFFVAALLICVVFGNILKDFCFMQYFVQGMRVFHRFEADLAVNLYEADLKQIEAASYQDMKETARRFLYGDGWGWGGVLTKAANVSAQFITLAGIISIISVLNPLVVLAFIGLVLLSGWFNSRVKKQTIKLDLERPAQERRLAYVKSLFEEYRFAKEIRVNSMGSWLLEKYWERMNILFGFYWRMGHNNFKAQIFSSVVSFIQQGIAYGYLIYSVINGHFGIGSFTMYLAAAASFSGAMNSLMESAVDLWRFNDYYDAADKYLNLPKHQREGKRLPLRLSSAPVIEFRDVSFRYPNQSTDVLKHINLVIQPGEKISIVGENGAGKTTFTKLFMRLYRPTGGVILLDDTDIQDYDFDEYMGAISAVFQDFSLFALSLRENVTLGREGVGDTLAEDALRRCGLGDKLAVLEKGLDTSIYKTLDDTGFEPSGGEGQKIAMARALLKDTPIIILDEPTAALDPRAEYEIYMNFNEMVKGKTALFISHRLSSSQFCDRVVVFRNGEIAETGTHQELIGQKGIYQELFAMQAQFYEQSHEEG